METIAIYIGMMFIGVLVGIIFASALTWKMTWAIPKSHKRDIRVTTLILCVGLTTTMFGLLTYVCRM